MRARTRLRIVALAAALLTAGALTACGQQQRTPPQQRPTPAGVIRLGSLMPLSGRNAPSGKAMLDAQNLAVSEANAAGGVLGRRVELVPADDACDPGTAVDAATKLVSQNIAVQVGGYCSSATVPTLQIFHDAGIPMVIPLSNSEELLEPKYDNIFLICGTAEAEARFAIASMIRLGSHRLAVVHDGTSFPLSLATSTVVAAHAAHGLDVVGEFELSQGAPSYRRIADQVRASGADTVYYTGYYADANRLIRDLRNTGYTGQIMVGDGAVDGPLLENLTPDQSRAVSGTTFMVPQFMPALNDWSARFAKAVGHAPGPSTPEAYDAVNLALDAIRRAGSLDHDAIRRAIASTTQLRLLSGDPRFNPDGTRVNPTFLLLTVKGGAFTYVTSQTAS